MASRGWAFLVAAACLIVASWAGDSSPPTYTTVEASRSAYSRYKGCPHNYYHRFRCNRWWGRRRHPNCCRGDQNLNDKHNLRVDTGSTAVVRFQVPAGESTRRAIVRFHVRDINSNAASFTVRAVNDNSVPNTRNLARGRPGARGSLVCTANMLGRNSVYECDVTKVVNERRDKKEQRWLTLELYASRHHARLSSSYTPDRNTRPQLVIENLEGWKVPDQLWATAYDDGWTLAGHRRGQAMWPSHPELLVVRSGSRNGHLRFRVPEWGVASGKARLVLFPTMMNSPIHVYGVDPSKSGNWNRDNLSWNHSPKGNAAGSKRICTLPKVNANQPAACDITEYVESVEEGWKFKGGVVEIRLEGGSANFRSSRTLEWNQKPRLELTYRFKEE